jgi:hypothetical protein
MLFGGLSSSLTFSYQLKIVLACCIANVKVQGQSSNFPFNSSGNIEDKVLKSLAILTKLRKVSLWASFLHHDP